jgi:hypothetical protein
MTDDQIQSESVAGEIILRLRFGSLWEKQSLLRLIGRWKSPVAALEARDAYCPEVMEW